MKYTILPYLGRLLACCLTIASVCLAKPTSIEATSLFKAKNGAFLIHAEDDDSYTGYSFLPPKKTAERNYMGYYAFTHDNDSEDDKESDFHVFAYCACKRASQTYDFFYAAVPAAPNSHIFHIVVKLTKESATLSGKADGESWTSDFRAYSSETDELEGLKCIVAEQKGPHPETIEKRLRAISAAHAQGGVKKVREILKGKLTEDIMDLCADDFDKGSPGAQEEDEHEEAETTPAPKSRPAAGSPADLPVSVQNNSKEKIRVGKKVASVVKRNDTFVTVSWLVEVTNTSAETLDFFSIYHNVLNEAELEIGGSMENVENLAPGETRKIKGSTLLETNLWDKAASHEFSID